MGTIKITYLDDDPPLDKILEKNMCLNLKRIKGIYLLKIPQTPTLLIIYYNKLPSPS